MNKRLVLLTTLSLAIVTAALLTGCATGYTPPPALDGPLNSTAQAIELERYATRSAAEVGAAEAQAQATAQAAVYQATAVAAQSQAEQERARATEQAAQVTAQAQATAQAVAAQQTAQAAAVQATATERAYQATATAQRQADDATATRAAWEGQATATKAAWESQVTATAQRRADDATATQQAFDYAATATAESQQATQVAYQATATRQAQQRDEILAYGRDYGIPLLLFALLSGLVFLIAYGVRQMADRPQIIQRDLRGDAPLLVLKTPNGERNLVDADRQPGHVTRILPNGSVEAPQLRSAGQEERTTARDQMVDLATRPRLGSGTQGGRAPALPMPAPPRAPAPGLRSVRVLRKLDQARQAGLLPSPLLTSLQADWEVEQ